MASVVKPEELFAILGFLSPDPLAQPLDRHSAVLKPAFGEHGHLEARHRPDPARNDFALERVKLLDGHCGESCERYPFCDFDHTGPGVGAEALESVMSSGGVSAQITPA